MKKYNITEERKKQFAGIYVLDYMINTPQSFSIFLDGNDQDLEPVLEWLMARDYVKIEKEEFYIPSGKGRDLLKQFMARYSEYLTIFDIFSAVDLEAGEFAFASYFDFKSDQSWQQFLDNERWDDLRIAVAEYKKMNPVEIVFMSFINEKKFGRDASGWQFDLLLGSVWDEIIVICNSAIQWQELGFEDDQGIVTAEEVIEDITSQGIDIILDLLRKEEQMVASGFLSTSGNGKMNANKIEIPGYSIDHYEKYRDPNYISPAWRSFWLV